jgi:hypothetical protein
MSLLKIENGGVIVVIRKCGWGNARMYRERGDGIRHKRSEITEKNIGNAGHIRKE